MKITTVAVAAMSTLAVAQPSFALGSHRNLVHTNHGNSHSGFALGELFTNCCGGEGNTASAEILSVPTKGFGAQLQVTQPTCCDFTYALSGISGIDGTRLQKTIRFVVTGLGTDAPPTANFGVSVFWTPPGHSSQVSNFFTVANGGLIRQGNQFTLVTGGHSGIAPGSTLNEVDFELDGNCVSAKQTAFVQNVFIDKTAVNYQLDAASAFCGGCS